MCLHCLLSFVLMTALCWCYIQVVGIFGFTGEDHIGKISFPAVQVETFVMLAWLCKKLYCIVDMPSFLLPLTVMVFSYTLNVMLMQLDGNYTT